MRRLMKKSWLKVQLKKVIPPPSSPIGESRLMRFSEPKLFEWKSSEKIKSSKEDMKMLSQIISKRHIVPIWLINAQDLSIMKQNLV